MHILFLSDNFPPETNAPASRTFEHATHWVKAGHQVTVITCAPNFPAGTLFPGYRNRWYASEDMDGVRVVRVKTYITANAGFLRRTLDYLSFLPSAFVAGLLLPRADVIVGTSPQFFAALGAWMLAAVRRRPFVFELRDLWPASIVTVGAMEESPVIRVLEKLELFLYRRAAAIVSVTRSFKAELVRRGIAPEKIAVVINGVDLGRYRPRARDSELATRYALDGKLVIGYLGTHGMANALHRVLEAAELLRGRQDIVFLLAGGGARRASLLATATAKKLDNVRLLPPQPKELMPRLWSLCDVSLIHLKDDPVFATVIPSKLFESLGMGLPVLMSLPAGEATRMVTAAGVGVIVPPEQPRRLADAVLELCDHPDWIHALGERSYRVAQGFSRAEQANLMQEVLEAVAKGRGNAVGVEHPSMLEPLSGE
jgi:glycosyltransferase involved in cell wall biosynthesis